MAFRTQDFLGFPYIAGGRFFKKLVLYRPYRRFPAPPLQLILYSSEQALWGALAAGRETEAGTNLTAQSTGSHKLQGRWSSNSRDVVAISLRKHPFLLALRRAKRPQRRRARRKGCFRRLLKLQLQALLPFPATPPHRPGELAHRLLILPLTVEFHDYKKG